MVAYLQRSRYSDQAGHQRTRQDATDPKQKAVTDYKEQVDRHPPHPPEI